jgi:hypothetical protein
MNKLVCLFIALSSFTTLKGQSLITTFPYFESFENFDDTGNLPGWSIYDIDEDGDYIWEKNTGSYFVRSGNSSIYHSFNLMYQEGWLVSPQIELPIGESFALFFWSINQFAGGNVNSVWILKESSNPLDGTRQEIWSSSAYPIETWENIGLNLTPYAGEKIYIAFRYMGNNAHRWYIDDVNVAKLSAFDAGVSEITAPYSKSNMTATESVTVKIKNFGNQKIGDVPVTLEVDGIKIATEILADSIAWQEETSYTFTATADLSAVQTHTIKVYTGLNDDSDTNNDTITIQVDNYGDCNVVSAFPFTESFEEDKVFFCWNTYDKENDQNCWILRNYDYKTGARSIVHESASIAQEGWLVTPQFILSTENSYQLSFWSCNWFSLSGGKNSVLISTGSGNPADEEFNEIWTTTSATQWLWEETVIDLAEYSGQAIYIAFCYQGTNHTWCLDDVNIVKLADNDVGATAIIHPVSGKNLGNETVTVTVRNFSSHNQSQIPVSLNVNGELVASEIISGTINSQSEINYTFPVTIDLSAVQKHTIKVYTTLIDDENTDNDTIIKYVVNYGNGNISSFPYAEGFESDDDLFLWTQEKDAENISWTYRAGGIDALISTAHSGDRNANFYAFISQGVTKLVTPPMNLHSLTAPILKFWYAQENYYGNQDILKIYYKNSATGNWIEIFEETKSVEQWTEAILELPNPSEEYYVAFEGNAHIGRGILLDDITVCDPADKDVALAAIVSPVNGANLGNETVVIKLKNMGLQTITAIPVYFKVNGEIVGNDIITGSFATFDTFSYTFENKANLSAAGTYTLEVYTALEGDSYTKNDTLIAQVINYGNKAVMGTERSSTTCGITFVDDGVDENYNMVLYQHQIITFYPEEEGKRIEATFTRFATSPFDIFMGVPIPGDSLIVYEGNIADENNRIAAFVGDLNDALPGTLVSHAPDGSLTFVFKKESGRGDEGWEATINCVNPLPYDAGVKRILSPLKGGSTQAKVIVELKNYGKNPITSMSVRYNQNEEHFSGNILPGETAEFEFSQTIDVSEIKEDHQITACTLLENDGDVNNNCVTVAFPYRQNITLYGYRIYTDEIVSPNAYGLVSFESNNPETVTPVNPYTDNGNLIAAGAYADDCLYVYSANQSGNSVNFIKLDKDWTEIASYPASERPLDMTYDYSTQTMFATVFNQGESDYQVLKTVDLSSGQLTFRAQFSYFFSVIACSAEGRLYAVASNGDFCSINKETGEAVTISNTGFYPAYIQSMAFDYPSGRLFWAMFDDNRSRLIEINPENGETTDWGTIDGNAEIVSLYTPYNRVKIETPVFDESPVIFPNPSDGFVSVSSVPEQSTIHILDLSGRMLQRYSNVNGKIDLNLNLQSGVYLIQIENKRETLIRKLIIK